MLLSDFTDSSWFGLIPCRESSIWQYRVLHTAPHENSAQEPRICAKNWRDMGEGGIEDVLASRGFDVGIVDVRVLRVQWASLPLDCIWWVIRGIVPVGKKFFKSGVALQASRFAACVLL